MLNLSSDQAGVEPVLAAGTGIINRLRQTWTIIATQLHHLDANVTLTCHRTRFRNAAEPARRAADPRVHVCALFVPLSRSRRR
jgi:hypothetical protein